MGRIHHRFQKGIVDHLARPDHLLGRILRWLGGRIGTDEALLRRLRTASEVCLHHPPSTASTQACQAWQAFLARGRRRHLVWLVVDGLAAPLTVVLAPLPGPNLVGYWVVFRAACHWLAWRGASRGARGRMPLSVVPLDELERASGETDADWATRVADHCGHDGPPHLIRAAGRAFPQGPGE
jgi:hypothetical protein